LQIIIVANYNNCKWNNQCHYAHCPTLTYSRLDCNILLHNSLITISLNWDIVIDRLLKTEKKLKWNWNWKKFIKTETKIETKKIEKLKKLKLKSYILKLNKNWNWKIFKSWKTLHSYHKISIFCCNIMLSLTTYAK
jgi:hypothetical protein